MGLLQEWLPEYTWPKLKASEGENQRFRGLGDDLQSDNDEWRELFDVKIAPLPSDYEQTFLPLDRLILFRGVRLDWLLNALTDFISNTLGKDYVSQKPFNMQATFEETNNRPPVFFVLFAGADPTSGVENLGKGFGYSLENECFALSISV
jgi:dynein heavy chain